MNFKKLLTLGTVVFLLTIMLSSLSFGQTYTRWVNSTDGQDSYNGLFETHGAGVNGPKKTLEAAYRDFPNDAVVHVTAGEYKYDQSGVGGGNDANGIDFDYTLAPVGTQNTAGDGKAMTFYVELYNTSPILYFNSESGAAGTFHVNSGTETIKFIAVTGAENIQIANGPVHATNVQQLWFESGTFDVSGLGGDKFTVGATVDLLTTTPNVRVTDGVVVGNFKYTTGKDRYFLYDAAAGNQTVGGEFWWNLESSVVDINRGAGTLTFLNNLTGVSYNAAAPYKGQIILNSGDAVFQGTIGITPGVATAYSILNASATGSLTFEKKITYTIKNNAGTVIENQTTGNITFLAEVSFVHASTGAADYTASIQNTSNGVLTLNQVTQTPAEIPAGTPYYIVVSLVNDTDDDVVGTNGITYIGGTAGASELRGALTNDHGKVYLTGNLTLRGILTNDDTGVNGNASELNLGDYVLTLAAGGVIAHVNDNSSTIVSSTTGYLNFANTAAGTTTVNGDGDLPNIVTNARDVTIAASTAINGYLKVSGAGNVILTLVTGITGVVELTSTGDLTMNVATAATIGGNVKMTNAGATFTTNPGGLLVSGTFDLTNGVFRTPGSANGSLITVSGIFTMTNGAITFQGPVGNLAPLAILAPGAVGGTDMIDFKSNFNRITGAITNTAGTFNFSSGGGGQVCAGGPNFRVWNLRITGVGTGITLTTGSIEIMNACYSEANTTVQLGTLNLYMIGNGANQATIINGGQIFSSGMGSVIFEGPGVGASTVNYIGGTGKYSNIAILLGDETDFVEVVAGTVVSWTKRLTIHRGGIDNSGGGATAMNPIDAALPEIWRNLNDAGGAAGSDGGTFNTPAAFNVNNVKFDLTYYGDVSLPNALGALDISVLAAYPEFDVPNVRNLSLVDAFSVPGTDYLELATVAKSITGSLFIAEDARLNCNGFDLTATGTGAMHEVDGLLSSTANTDQFIITGSGQINSAGTGARTIEELNFNPANAAYALQINDLWQLGKNAAGFGVNIVKGIVTLKMANTGTTAAPNPGDIYNYNQAGGTVTLGYDFEVPATANTGFYAAGTATFDFANYNIWWKGTTAGANFTSAAGTTFLATGATTGGYLQFRASGDINTAGARLQRIWVDPLKTGGLVARLLGATGVNDILVVGNTVSNAGVFTSQLNTNGQIFTHNGTVWTHITTTNYGTGTMKITGNVTLTMYGPGTGTTNNYAAGVATPQVATLVVNNGANTFTLARQTSGTGDRQLLVGTNFTMTDGTVDFTKYDIVLNNGAAVGVFTYTAGLFNATTVKGTTAADTDNGELVFNNAANVTFAAVPTPIIPNLRIAGNAANTVTGSATSKLKVSGRFVFGDLSAFNVNSDGFLTIGDQAWVERRGTITINKVPSWEGVMDLYYNNVIPVANIPTAKELPTTTTVLRDLFVNAVATKTVTLAAPVTINRALYLMTGDLKTSATNLASMANLTGLTVPDWAEVHVINGSINATPVASANLAGGPIDLFYENTIPLNTANGEYPTTMTVHKLSVMSDQAAVGYAGPAPLTLHADRSCGSFLLETDQTAPLAADVEFDLDGNTLTVTDLNSAELKRGVLTSYAVTATVFDFGTLDVAGSLTTLAASTINNVNVICDLNAAMAGAIGAVDFDGAGGNTLPVTPMYVNVLGLATITGAFGNANPLNLTAYKDVTVGTGGSLTANTNIAFVGTVNANFTVPSAGAAIGSLTFSKTGTAPTPVIELKGGNITQVRNGGALTTFVNGIFKTGNFIFTMNQPNWGGGQGFTHVITGSNVSHVVGNVAKVSYNNGSSNAGSSEKRFEFPVGTLATSTAPAYYRPAALNFEEQFGQPKMPNRTFTVSHFDLNPGGGVALPIKNGVATGIDVSRYPSFYWTIAADPNSVGPSTWFDVEFTATGFTGYDDINNVRIIRRHGLPSDVGNEWLFQGVDADLLPDPALYDNELHAGVPSIIQKNANAGLRYGGAVFTLGLRSNMSIHTPIADQWLVIGNPARNLSLANTFQGNLGILSFAAQSSNTTRVAATIVAAVPPLFPAYVKLTPGTATGDALVTVVAQDLLAGIMVDSYAFTFNVNVGLTDVEAGEEIPTEFSLSQNFPNPFNPTTNIKFGLPKESNVSLKIYNILGQEVATLVNKVMPAGFHTVDFNATKLSSGMYIYRIEAGDFVQVKKMLLMK